MNPERYIAIVRTGDNELAWDALAAQVSDRTLVRYDISPEIRILAAQGLSVLQGPECVVVGGMFGDTGAAMRAGVRPDEIIARCWGNYLAIGMNAGGKPDWILRAPLGHLPAYRMCASDCIAFASHPDLLLRALGQSPEIDWDFAIEHLAFAHLVMARTGLRGIDELLPGECLSRQSDMSWRREAVWTPWAWTQSDRVIDDPAKAAEALRTAVNGAVANLLPAKEPCLLELSGGLDSSVLAAALAIGRIAAQAVTLRTPGTESDEREYARATALATGLPLAEIEVSSDVRPTTMERLRSARPGMPGLLSAADQVLAELGRERGVSAFVSGAGGDCVFCSPVSAAPAADVMIRLGLRQSWQTIEELARIHYASFWEVARMAWRQSRRPPLHDRWPITPGFLVPDLVPCLVPDHPWFNPPNDILPGKRSHVRTILGALAHVADYRRHEIAPSRFPLLSQPVVETALRIPSWLWTSGGQDRAIARNAYHGFLPQRVLDRRVKGGLDAYCIAIAEAQRGQLRPFLLEGHLAHRGIIDRTAVEACLSRSARRDDPAIYRLFPLVDLEGWVRAWLGGP